MTKLLFVALLQLFTVQISSLLKFSSYRRVNLTKHALKAQKDVCDVAIIGAGIGGLSAAAILSAKYNLKVNVYEAHYYHGGCAHSFPIRSKESKVLYNFDAGPTILLGCSTKPLNPLAQVLNAVGASSLVDWISYDSWGMFAPETGPWKFQLGPDKFEQGPLLRFGGREAVEEFERLREACKPLCVGAASIPTMALRGDQWKVLPLLLKHYDALQKVIPYSTVLDGSFAPLLEGISQPWLKSWLDALAFSLSGLPARESSAGALAYTLYDLHREGAALDYPRGGMGKISEALVKVIEETGSEVFLRSGVQDIVLEKGKTRGIVLQNKQTVKAKYGVICNANIWSLPSLLNKAKEDGVLSDAQSKFLEGCGQKRDTKSFLHLHLGLNAKGLRRSNLSPHYTVMHKNLDKDPCGDRNMVAVSNPSLLDSSLTSDPDHIMLHAYGAGNEPYDAWKSLQHDSEEYKQKKERDSEYLYESISYALGIPVQEVKERSDVALVGTPLTHKHFLNRHRGSYGVEWRDVWPSATCPIPGLFVAGDSIFPGIGVPAVAVSGAAAANSIVNPLVHLLEVMKG